MVTGKIKGTLTSLLNVYVPPGSYWSLYKHIVDLMITKSQGILLCGGDFNIQLNPKLHSSNGKSVSRSINRRLNTYLREVGIVDGWRELNPTCRDYSHYSSTHSVYSRIDYLFMLKGVFFRVNNCKMGPTTISKHGTIYMSVHVISTLWRLNANILNNQSIKENLKSEISMYLETNDNEEVTPPTVWVALKAVIRRKIIAISSHERKMKEQKLEILEKELKIVQNDMQSPLKKLVNV